MRIIILQKKYVRATKGYDNDDDDNNNNNVNNFNCEISQKKYTFLCTRLPFLKLSTRQPDDVPSKGPKHVGMS
jgi:hypothetical protein